MGFQYFYSTKMKKAYTNQLEKQYYSICTITLITGSRTSFAKPTQENKKKLTNWTFYFDFFPANTNLLLNWIARKTATSQKYATTHVRHSRTNFSHDLQYFFSSFSSLTPPLAGTHISIFFIVSEPAKSSPKLLIEGHSRFDRSNRSRWMVAKNALLWQLRSSTTVANCARVPCKRRRTTVGDKVGVGFVSLLARATYTQQGTRWIVNICSKLMEIKMCTVSWIASSSVWNAKTCVWACVQK